MTGLSHLRPIAFIESMQTFFDLVTEDPVAKETIKPAPPRGSASLQDLPWIVDVADLVGHPYRGISRCFERTRR